MMADDYADLLPDPPKHKTLADYGINGRASAVVIDCEQGKGAWFGARSGRLTASNVGKVVTATGKASTSATRDTYRNKLIAERLTGSVEMERCTPAMERGNELEPKARNWYAFEKGVDVAQVGFVYHDASKRWGVSPDGLCGGVGGLEIKCPMRPNMIRDLIANACPNDYVPQVQFQMWVCGLEWIDFMSWTPDQTIPNMVVRCFPNEKLHAAYEIHVPAFCDELDELTAKLKERL
jgi:putative phage-type endonuclease